MIRPILAAAAFSVAVMPAFAASADKFEMTVKIDHAALATMDGAEQQFAEIKDKVHERCVIESSERGYASRFAVGFCERRTLKSAVTAINDPNLTAVYKTSLSK
jgi:UrcA family protein